MDSMLVRSYETPRITNYGSVAELTAMHDLVGLAPLGQIGMSLSAVVAPPTGGELPLTGGGPPGGVASPGGPPPVAPPPGHGVLPFVTSGSGDETTMPAGSDEITAGGDRLGTTSAGTPGEAPTGGGQGVGGGSGGLPFTGAAVSLLAAAGAALVALGAALRRAVRRC